MKEILCFGDSNTHGYMPGLGTRYPIDQRWSGLLGKLLGDGYHVVEEGMDGRTTAFEDDLQPWRSALGYIGPCVKTHAPLDLIIIMLGTNDSKTRYGVSAEEIGFGMQELIIRIKALMGKAFSFTETKVSSRFEIGSYLFDPVAQTLLHAGVRQELSHRESEILKRLCENRNQVVNTQDVLLELWGDDSFFNSRSLHVFITKLRHKLSQDEQIRIVNVRGIGYKLIAN